MPEEGVEPTLSKGELDFESSASPRGTNMEQIKLKNAETWVWMLKNLKTKKG